MFGVQRATSPTQHNSSNLNILGTSISTFLFPYRWLPRELPPPVLLLLPPPLPPPLPVWRDCRDTPPGLLLLPPALEWEWECAGEYSPGWRFCCTCEMSMRGSVPAVSAPSQSPRVGSKPPREWAEGSEGRHSCSCCVGSEGRHSCCKSSGWRLGLRVGWVGVGG